MLWICAGRVLQLYNTEYDKIYPSDRECVHGILKWLAELESKIIVVSGGLIRDIKYSAVWGWNVTYSQLETTSVREVIISIIQTNVFTLICHQRSGQNCQNIEAKVAHLKNNLKTSLIGWQMSKW